MENSRNKIYDLEERTLAFAKRTRALFKQLPFSIANSEDTKQLARSSASVGANYIEANESLGKKDFALHIKISRKEAKECVFFLKLVDAGTDATLEKERTELITEATELMKIFGAILQKVKV